jgi:hypothetical protein
MISQDKSRHFMPDETVYSPNMRLGRPTKKPVTQRVLQKRLGRLIGMWVEDSDLTYLEIAENISIPRQALPQVFRAERKLDFIEGLLLLEMIGVPGGQIGSLLDILRAMRDEEV